MELGRRTFIQGGVLAGAAALSAGVVGTAVAEEAPAQD